MARLSKNGSLIRTCSMRLDRGERNSLMSWPIALVLPCGALLTCVALLILNGTTTFSPLVHGFYWDDTWTPTGVGDDPEKGMIQDMGLSKEELLQLTASYEANMLALRNRTLAEGKFAWQLLTAEHVSATNPARCKSDLAKYCQHTASPQTEAMYYPASTVHPGTPAFTNCSVFGCTCKGAADYLSLIHI